MVRVVPLGVRAPLGAQGGAAARQHEGRVQGLGLLTNLNLITVVQLSPNHYKKTALFEAQSN